MTTIPVDQIRFVKELYPRLKQDDAAIERYRAAIDRLPPITVARDGVLVDGFHRWLAYKREGASEIPAEDLGNLTDAEILKESVRRNASHGRQLERGDKKRMAELLWRQGTRDEGELVGLLSITPDTLETYLRTAKAEEKQRQQDRAWDLWLDCWSLERIGADPQINRSHQTISDWVAGKRNDPVFGNAPESQQHTNLWSFQAEDGYFGQMPPSIVENLLWLWTEPGQIVVDPFAGGGTTIDVAKQMGRRIWASDRIGSDAAPLLPIHRHDITTGWPTEAPSRVDLILLDPPYWQQAKGRYSDDPADLANMALPEFNAAWERTIKACADHLADGGHLAYIVSPTLDGDLYVDHAFEMYGPCVDAGLRPHRRIIVPYSHQNIAGHHVTRAREGRSLLTLHRDLVVFSR